MYIVCVKIDVLPEKLEEFVAETQLNARGARTEPGNLRFDVLRAADGSPHFCLYEVYREEKDFFDHQKTPHYLRWKERAPGLMSSPRTSQKYRNLFPEPWV